MHFLAFDGDTPPAPDQINITAKISTNEISYPIIDPALGVARNCVMLAFDTYPHAPAPPPIGLAPALLKGRHDIAPPPPSLSEQTRWMLAVRDHRDKAAFAQLFDFYAPRLKGVLMRGGATSARAEDVVQDVMLTLWRKAHMFDPERAQVSAWVYRIARNRNVDLARKAARAVPQELAPEPDAEPDAAQSLALEQEAAQLRIALSRLKPDQKALIEQAYLGELTHSEITAQTGLPLGTVKSRIRLGLERLRHELKGLRQP